MAARVPDGSFHAKVCWSELICEQASRAVASHLATHRHSRPTWLHSDAIKIDDEDQLLCGVA